MNKRHLVPELLDNLPHDDPEAVRSRQDLRRINFMMGNERWVLRVLERHPSCAARGVTEIGAGDGALAMKIARRFSHACVTAHDLMPCPALPHDVEDHIEWRAGDVFQHPPTGGGVLVANLFLHHFEGDALRLIGAMCGGFDMLVFNEPDRSWLALALGFSQWPVVNRVTRHDMMASIRGGFRHGELPAMLELDHAVWQWKEYSTMRGARRITAWRRG